MEKLRLIQCGMGGMGKTWWKNATGKAADFEIAGIVDILDEPLNEAGEALGVEPIRRFKSLESAIEAVDADAVLTVTPPAVHVEHARLAFANGLHLLTEKPIADTLANARLMVKLAKDASRQFVVAQNYRFSPAIKTLRRVFEEKRIGEFGHGHIDFYIAADFTGSFRQTMKFPLLVDMAIHHLDLIRAVTGRNIAKVNATSFAPPWNWYDHHPGLKMLMELDDDTPFSYTGDWSALGKQTTWNGNWRLQCAEGSIHLEDDQVTIERCQRWGKDPSSGIVEPDPDNTNGQARLLTDFAKAIQTGALAETSGQDNLWSFAAVMAGVISATERRTVEVESLVAG